ncbi:pseudouridine synthase [Smaragdicoccus niigatensis]|uniref:pseudouridine synthase n=1 Tax=Smaragdicoccus niigatensis TaxID=359359 RepID=UPI0003748E3B|nr:pseudouridine synthase [Smaragdicoccus niigatensis]
MRLPAGSFATVAEYLVSRFGETAIEAVNSENVLDERLAPIDLDTQYRANATIWIYREPAEEVAVPFDIEIVHRDDDLVVIDKPHFLATMPRGRHVTESVLVRLRRLPGLEACSPAHRLDRLTAGVLICTVRPEVRGAYHELFASGQAEKTYEAIAPVSDAEFPLTCTSRIVKERGVLQAREITGAPNSETVVSKVETRGDFARYECRPITGKTHQIRVHLNALGIPIVGDPLYPEVLPDAAPDFTNPLRLLAKSIAFRDPITSVLREFRSHRTLDWPDQAKSK